MRSARALAVAVALWSAGWAGAAPADLVPPSRAWVKISAAELAARYDTLFAVSDVHGRLEELEQLLVGSGLAVRRGPAIAWSRGRALLVVAGDLVDGGPDSVGVVLLLERLQREAAAEGSRVVVLLGNHDAKLLARPRSATREVMASAARRRAELGLSRWFGARALDRTAFAGFLRELPVAAFVGSWLFAHAGYIDSEAGEPALRAWFARLDETLAPRDASAFAALLDPRSIVEYHDWWRSEKHLAKMRHRLGDLGLNGLVFGHDPDALGAPGTIAMNRDGWLIKLDAGLKLRASRGMLLRCEVRDIVSADELAMSRDGRPTCHVDTPDGSARALAVR
jgi:Calcineurin-like phosphoesterase